MMDNPEYVRKAITTQRDRLLRTLTSMTEEYLDEQKRVAEMEGQIAALQVEAAALTEFLGDEVTL